jgi:hypothetical protein
MNSVETETPIIEEVTYSETEKILQKTERLKRIKSKIEKMDKDNQISAIYDI